MKIVARVKENATNYLKNNFREYALVALLFIIGLFIGVMVVNNCEEKQIQEVTTYISDFIQKFKESGTINKMELIIKSIKSNVFLTLVLWIAGTAVIGLPIVLIVILLRGLFLGYTVSAITYTLGTIKGIIFCLISLLLQNILFIPALLTLGVSSIKLYKSIIKDKRKENIKIEIFRHTVISSLMLGILIFSSLIENIISISVLRNLINYF